MSTSPLFEVVTYVDAMHQVLDEASYYQLLGVKPGADGSEIRSAYYSLAVKLHPDRHGESIDAEFRDKLTAVFSRVVEAYNCLVSDEKRHSYDQGLSQGEVRLATKAKIKQKPEETISDSGARRFFLLGQQAYNSRDAKTAVMNLRMALSREPENAAILELLALAEKLSKGA